jgi:hypothetical protein
LQEPVQGPGPGRSPLYSPGWENQVAGPWKVHLARAAGICSPVRDSRPSASFCWAAEPGSQTACKPANPVILSMVSTRSRACPTLWSLAAMGRCGSEWNTAVNAVQPKDNVNFAMDKARVLRSRHRGQAQTELSGGSGSAQVGWWWWWRWRRCCWSTPIRPVIRLGSSMQTSIGWQNIPQNLQVQVCLSFR